MNQNDTTPQFSALALAGFVTLTEWTILEHVLNVRLDGDPAEPLVVECGTVTGFAPAALTALCHLLRSAPGRIQLRNWPAEAARAIGQHLQLARAIGEAVATLSAAQSDPESSSAECEALAATKAQLAELVAELKRLWFASNGASAEPGAAGRRPIGGPSAN
jgi:hypothetical protein